jgi:plasmid stabilization system protein ParE
MGARRRDITLLPVRFWTISKFPNYVIVYRPETIPLQVIAILHGKRDLPSVLESRP